MSKNTPAETAPVENVVVEPALSLSDFCQRLSETVNRPELISAFHYGEKQLGRVSDTQANFRARFDAFVNKPI